MSNEHVIIAMLQDLSQQQHIQTALCIGQNLEQYNHNHVIQWQYFKPSEFLNLPFTQRYDFGFVDLNREFSHLTSQQKSQILVKLRDLFVKSILVWSTSDDQKMLRSLGFTQLNDQQKSLWQFNILTYKHVPDWFNSKFWANPENWDKFRW